MMHYTKFKISEITDAISKSRRRPERRLIIEIEAVLRPSITWEEAVQEVASHIMSPAKCTIIGSYEDHAYIDIKKDEKEPGPAQLDEVGVKPMGTEYKHYDPVTE